MTTPLSPETLWLDGPLGRIHAQRWGTASDALAPIVLFHDSLGCVDVWRDFPAQLANAAQRQVIAYDRLGFGRSDPHPATLALDFVQSEPFESFRTVREGLGLSDFVAFGHSVGGGMAVASAAAYGDECRALVTESAQSFVEDRTIAGIRAAERNFAQPGQLDRLRKYHGDKAEWVLRAWVDTWLSPGFRDWNVDESLRNVRCPVLAMHGEHDEFGSTKHPHRIAALAGGPTTVRILDCGHVPHREMASDVLQIVGRWLEA